MYVGRLENGSIYGAWLNLQWPRQEFLPEDDAELVTFLTRTPPTPTPEQRLAATGLTINDLKQLLGLE